MNGDTIVDAHVRWAVDGRPATEDEALAALATRPLLVLMHGFGSFEGDLIGLAPQLPPGFVCASPRAPHTAPEPIVNGFSWWPMQVSPEGAVVRQPPPTEFVGSGPHGGASAVLAWLDALEGRIAARESVAVAPGAGSSLGPVAIMGFSQGGCLVTSLLRLQPNRFSCGVNCSGFVAAGAFDGDAALAATRPPMFWGGDPHDPIIGPERIAELAEWAPRHTTLEAREYAGIAHSISADELRDIAAFLAAQVPAAAEAVSPPPPLGAPR